MARGYRSIPTKGYPYFLYDAEGEGMQYYSTSEERDEAAKRCIVYYLDESLWNEDVARVATGFISGCAQQVGREDRPTGMTDEELEEAGWSSDEGDYRCNYEILPLFNLNEPASRS